jgi:hypothetical protein
MGYCFECMLNGLLIMKRSELVTNERELDSRLANHNVAAHERDQQTPYRRGDSTIARS